MKRTLSITLFFWGCTFTQGPQLPIPSHQADEIVMGHFADLPENSMGTDRLKLSMVKDHFGDPPQLAFDSQ